MAVHVVVYAKDLERLRRFYESVPDLDAFERGTGFVVLGGFSVVAVPQAVADKITIHSPPALREDTPNKASFLVAAIEERRGVIEQARGILKPAADQWEWRHQLHLDGADPEGNVFQLRQRSGTI
ncbi:MAG: hypothetical protein RIC56_24125 [Pseudomonadales bacterium]